MLDVSIIIINYNTYELSKNCIESILAHTNDISYEIILVDNLSVDGSGKELNNYFKNRIKYMQSDANIGTSKGFNLGLKCCIGKYVLWLNSDTLLQDNFIKELFTYMEKNPLVGICGGNVLDFKGQPMHSYFRKLPNARFVKYNLSITCALYRKAFKRKINYQYNYSKKPLEVGYITGADMMIRKQVIDEIGEFCEEIFMYSEETEFTFRVKKAGYKVISLPSAQILHLEGASFKGNHVEYNDWRFRTMLNGNLIYIEKCFGKKEVVKYLKALKLGNKKRYLFFKLIAKPKESMLYKRQYLTVDEYLKQRGDRQ